MRDFLKKISPPFLIEFYRSLKRKKRHKDLDSKRSQGKITGKKEIVSGLQDLGLKNGDLLMLHSSLSSLGYVDGGAAAVIDSVLSAIGKEGTLMMPAFPGTGFNYDYLKKHPVFDLKNTPSKMGSITETFRNMPGVERSLHPSDSVCAFGPKAHELVKDHFGQLTPYNSQSPFYRLCEMNGKICMMGVDLTTLTNLHTLEDAVAGFKFPVYHSEVMECAVIDADGKKRNMRTKCHDPAWSKKRKCNELKPYFLAAGFLKESKIGEAKVMMIDARAMHEWMLKNYKEKGITMYTPRGS